MSAHLDHIIDKQHGSTNATVVFLDVVKYSMRKSIVQQRVIQAFNETLRQTIESVSAKHVTDSQKQKLNLADDIVKIPTGDGAAIVFPFQGLQNIHLDFALEFLNHSLSYRKDIICDAFSANGWCNCHSFFDVRIGISDGKVIVYKDINGSYNIAGGTINIASRVMGLADRQQIIFTLDAYNNIIDMTEDTTLEDSFIKHGNVNVKHDISVSVCQYIGKGENYLNKDVPVQIDISQRENILKKSSPLFADNNPKSPAEQLKRLEVLEILKDMPIPDGFKDMMTTSGGLPDKESAKAIVDAFKVIDQLMKSGIPGKIIEASKKED
jgi:class 3 adenylate cyclase